jgi:hypothetical protein
VRRQVGLILFLLAAFAVELVAGVELVRRPRNSSAADFLCNVLVALLLIGVARAWELVGDRDTGIIASIAALVGRDGDDGDDGDGDDGDGDGDLKYNVSVSATTPCLETPYGPSTPAKVPKMEAVFIMCAARCLSSSGMNDRTAKPNPIPLAAPVTTATWPGRRPGSSRGDPTASGQPARWWDAHH